MRITLFLLLIGIIYSSCVRDSSAPNQEIHEVLKPIYATNLAEMKTIRGEAARTTTNPGKIYALGNYAFQVEKDSGIHVINMADPTDPKKLGFIRSVLCKEISIKDGKLYTNNISDLVVIDISSVNNVKEISRVSNVFPDLALQYPPKDNSFSTVYFECPDPFKGVIIGWEKSSAKTAKCWR